MIWTWIVHFSLCMISLPCQQKLYNKWVALEFFTILFAGRQMVFLARDWKKIWRDGRNKKSNCLILYQILLTLRQKTQVRGNHMITKASGMANVNVRILQIDLHTSLNHRTHHTIATVVTGSLAMITRERIQRARLVSFDSKASTENNSKVQFYQQCPQISVGGRLRFFMENWGKITDDQWVLSVIEEGYKLEFALLNQE